MLVLGGWKWKWGDGLIVCLVSERDRLGVSGPAREEGTGMDGMGWDGWVDKGSGWDTRGQGDGRLIYERLF